MIDEFDQFFGGIYGKRWPVLKESLLKTPVKVDRSCFNGFAIYTLDEASIVAAQALPLNDADRVLDMCAAPGGKALVLAEELFKKGPSGELFVNELSFARRKRLEEVLKTHVPGDDLSKVQICSWDAEKIGIRGEAKFDKILLDAPCSSERHLLHQDPTMREWKISRTKQLAKRQYALLCSAMLALKPGGIMVYSTCSISTFENDGVIERYLERKQEQGELQLDLQLPNTNCKIEKTKFGHQIFPDESGGSGPIYFSVLKKKII